MTQKLNHLGVTSLKLRLLDSKACWLYVVLDVAFACKDLQHPQAQFQNQTKPLMGRKIWHLEGELGHTLMSDSEACWSYVVLDVAFACKDLQRPQRSSRIKPNQTKPNH
jgi:hypothetical protein